MVSNEAILAGLDGRFDPIWSKRIAFLLATGVTTVLNFVGMRLFTFRQGIAERMQTTETSPAVLSRGPDQAPARSAGAKANTARAA